MTPWANCAFPHLPKPAFHAQCQSRWSYTNSWCVRRRGLKPHPQLRSSPILPSLQPPGFAFPLNNTLGELRLAPTPHPAFLRSPLRVSPLGGVRPAPGGNLVPNVISNTKEAPRHITERFNQPRAAAVSVVGFIRRHNRASIAVAVGLGIVALTVRRAVTGARRQAAQTNPIHDHKEVIHHDDEPGIPIHLQEVGTTE